MVSLKKTRLTPTRPLQAGFTAVELMVTILVAALFILAFYQLYVSTNRISAESRWLIKANSAAYAQLQIQEAKSFDELETENPDPTDITHNCYKDDVPGNDPIGYKIIPDFTSDLTDVLEPSKAYVCLSLSTPTLKVIDVMVVYGPTKRTVEYTSYIQAGEKP